jgi:hypothetical protein
VSHDCAAGCGEVVPLSRINRHPHPQCFQVDHFKQRSRDADRLTNRRRHRTQHAVTRGVYWNVLNRALFGFERQFVEQRFPGQSGFVPFGCDIQTGQCIIDITRAAGLVGEQSLRPIQRDLCRFDLSGRLHDVSIRRDLRGDQRRRRIRHRDSFGGCWHFTFGREQWVQLKHRLPRGNLLPGNRSHLTGRQQRPDNRRGDEDTGPVRDCDLTTDRARARNGFQFNRRRTDLQPLFGFRSQHDPVNVAFIGVLNLRWCRLRSRSRFLRSAPRKAPDEDQERPESSVQCPER